MKRLFVLLIALTLLLSAVTGVAYADGRKYILIENDSTYLYSDEACSDKKAICILPKTYYVQCDGEDYKKENSYKVVFLGKQGYIKESDVSTPVSDSLVANDYANMVEQLKSHTPQSGAIMLYDEDFDEKHTVTADSVFTYLGHKKKGKYTYYYVLTNNEFGYFDATDLPDFNLSSIPTYTKPTPAPSATAGASASASASANKPAESTNGVVKILLIIGICIPAAIIVYLLFKPAKAPDARYTGDEPKRNDRNDEDDYR